jgi:hypothetical protein
MVMAYVWEPRPAHLLEDAHRAEFWEACDDLTNVSNANIALQHACVAGNEGIINMVTSRCLHDLSRCLLTAATHGKHLAVAVLLNMGATDIQNALIIAAERGHLSAVQILMSYGGTNAYGLAFAGACRNNHAHVARVLLPVYKPSHNIWIATIENAAMLKRVDIIRMYLELTPVVPYREWMMRSNISTLPVGEGETKTLLHTILQRAP